MAVFHKAHQRNDKHLWVNLFLIVSWLQHSKHLTLDKIVSPFVLSKNQWLVFFIDDWQRVVKVQRRSLEQFGYNRCHVHLISNWAVRWNLNDVFLSSCDFIQEGLVLLEHLLDFRKPVINVEFINQLFGVSFGEVVPLQSQVSSQDPFLLQNALSLGLLWGKLWINISEAGWWACAFIFLHIAKSSFVIQINIIQIILRVILWTDKACSISHETCCFANLRIERSFLSYSCHLTKHLKYN